MTNRERVTQDDLYKYLQAHDVNISCLAKMMGFKKPEPLLSYFKHHKDWHGRPRKLNVEHIAKMNEVLQRYAEELLACRLEFGTPSVITNKNGKVFDPGLVEPIKNIGKYLNITAMLKRVAGWSVYKKNNVLSRTEGSMVGRISKDDVVAINAELLSIVGVLSGYELVSDADGNK